MLQEALNRLNHCLVFSNRLQHIPAALRTDRLFDANLVTFPGNNMCAAPSQEPENDLRLEEFGERHILLLAPVDHGLHTLFEQIQPKKGRLEWQDVEEVPGNGVREVQKAKYGSGDPIPFESKVATFVHLSGIYRIRTVLFSAADLWNPQPALDQFFKYGNNAVVILDAVEGMAGIQADRIVRQIVDHGISPILFINKVDRLFRELCLSPEEAYRQCDALVERFNAILLAHAGPNAPHILPVDPVQGQVIFGSASQGWAFTIPHLCKVNPSLDIARVKQRLWGDHFFDRQTNKFYQTNVHDGRAIPRFASVVVMGFVSAVFEHIGVPVKEPMTEKSIKILETLKVSMPEKIWYSFQYPGKRVAYVLSRFSPLADVLGEVAIEHLQPPPE